MSDLARQRSSRDLWISRGHIYAAIVGTLLLMSASFVVGYGAGRDSVGPVLAPPAAFASESADVALVEMLARVDAGHVADGGVRQLTFPDQLSGSAEATTLPNEPVQNGEAHLEPALPQLPGGEDAPPVGRWTVAAGSVPQRQSAVRLSEVLRAAGLEPWLGIEHIDGEVSYRVGVGGFGSRAEAETALPALKNTIELAGGEARVVRY